MQDRGTDLRNGAKKESTGMARLQWLVRKLSRREGNALALPLALALVGSSIAREREAVEGQDQSGSGGSAETHAGLRAGDRLALMTGDAVLGEHLLTEAEVASGQVRLALRVIENTRLPDLQGIEMVHDAEFHSASGSAAVVDVDSAATTADAAGVAGEGASVAGDDAVAGADDVAPGGAAPQADHDDDDRSLLWLVFGIGAVGTGVALAVSDSGSSSAPGPDPDPPPPPPPPPPVTAGYVIKGYIQGAAVYLDTNHDGLPDGDPVYTDAQGRFTFATSNSGASIVVYGGVDTLTNVPLEGMILRAPAGSTVVTPLTTLLEGMMRADTSLTAAEAQTKLLAALDLTLPAGADLRTYDSVAGIGTGGAAVEDSAEVVLNTLASIQSLLTGAGVAGSHAASDTATSALVQVILQSSGAVNLADPGTVQSVLEAAFTGSGVGASNAGDMNSLAAAIAAVNGALVEASGVGDSALQLTRYALSGFQDLLTGIGANAQTSDQYNRDISFSSNESLASAVAQVIGDISESVTENSSASISYAERLEGDRFVFAFNPALKFHEGAPDKIDAVTVKFDVEGVILQRETRAADGTIVTQTLTPDGNGRYTLQYSELDKIFIQAPEQFNGVLGAEVTAHYVGLNITDSPEKFGIQIIAVNDAPASANATVSAVEDTPYVFSVADFPFSDGTDLPYAGGANALHDIRIVSLPQSGTLYLGKDAITSEDLQGGLFVSAADIATGVLAYVPGEDGHGDGYASFQFQVRDDGGTDRGGMDLDPVIRTLTVNVVPVSDAPESTSGAVETDEDTPYTFAVGDFGFADIDGDALAKVIITSLPDNGVLKYGDVVLEQVDLGEDGYEIDAANVGNLSFVPEENYAGDGVSFGYKVQDSGSDGLNLSGEATMAILVNQVDDTPVATSGAVVTDEDTPYAFTAGDFGFTDIDDDALEQVIITSLPDNGVLKYGDVELEESDLADGGYAIDVANIGNLTFVPEENYAGDGVSFGYKVQDTGSDGLNLSLNSGTLSITVNPVSDTPEATSGSVELDEDGEYTFQIADFGFSDVDGENGDALASVIITSLPGNGMLYFNGNALTGEDLGEDSGFTVAAGNLGLLTFVPNEDYAGPASFNYQVQDSGSDGLNLSLNSGTLNITVNPLSDAPTATSGSVELDEDGEYTFQIADFGFSDVDGENGDALASVIITSLPGDGTLYFNGEELTGEDLGEDSGFAVAAAELGLLTFVPDADYNGPASFSYKVQDSGSEGLNMSQNAGTLSITVNPVSDAPEATSGSVETEEDTPYTFSAEDFGFSDIDGDELAKVFITSLPINGVLKYDNVELEESDLADGGYEIDVANIGNLTFVPEENYAGDGVSFGYKVQDTGSEGSNLSEEATLSVFVSQVDDAPVSGNKTVNLLEDSEGRTLGASDFPFTDVDDHELAEVIITSLPGSGRLYYGETLITSGLLGEDGYAVTAEDLDDGKLVFVPDADYNGEITIGFKVRDTGESEDNLSAAAATLTLKVKAVNDDPTFDVLGRTFEVTTLEDIVDAYDDLMSLREALALVKNGDRIVFSDDLLADGDGVIELGEGGALEIKAGVYINGVSEEYPDNRITLKTDGSHSAIVVEEGAMGVVLSGLRIEGSGEQKVVTGNAGDHAALVNHGGLTLHNVSISDYWQTGPQGSSVISVLVNHADAELTAFGLTLDNNRAIGSTGTPGASAYLVHNSGTMSLVGGEISNNLANGGSGGSSPGGDAYLVYNAGDAELLGQITYDENQTVGGSSATATGTNSDYAGYDNAPPLDIEYEAPSDQPLSYTEGGTGILIAPKARISDVELDALNDGLGDWSGASVTIARKGSGHNKRAGRHDDFEFVDGNSLSFEDGKIYKEVEGSDPIAIGTWSETSRGKLTITFNTSEGDGAPIPTTEDVDNVLRQIAYRNTSDNPGESVTLVVTVKDGNARWNGEQGKGGEGRVVAEIDVGLVNVNDAPDARKNSVRIDEDDCRTFDASDFRFRDAEDDDLKAVIITGLPANGKLYYCGEELTDDHLQDGGFLIKDCDLDKLTFKPDEDFHGKATFQYKLQDTGGILNSGEDTSDEATFEIKVRSINDNPKLDLGGEYTFVVTTLSDIVDDTDDVLSLREALAQAQNGDSIGFATELMGGILNLGSPLEISSSVYVEGMVGEERITLKTGGTYTAVYVSADAVSGNGVILSGLIIQGDAPAIISGELGEQSAIVNWGMLTLNSVEVTDYEQITSNEKDIVSVLFNGLGATLNASDLYLHGNSAVGSPGPDTGYSAYLIYNAGTMDLGDAEITGNLITGGTGGDGDGWGGSAYLIYEALGATTLGNVDFGDGPDSQVVAGVGDPEGYAKEYSGSGGLEGSEFQYQQPDLRVSQVYIEGEDGVLIAPDATLSDPELDKLNGGDGDWSGASIEIARKSSGHHGRGGKDDDFGFAGNENLYLSHGKIYKVVEGGDPVVIGTWSESSRGKLTITFKTSNGDDALIPTTEDVNNILRQVTYQNESDDPKESVTLTVTVKDGNAKWNGEQGKGGEGRVAGEIDVQLVNVNDAPKARKNSIRIDEDDEYPFSASDFRFKDAEDDELQAVIITGLPDPEEGTLEYYDGCEWIALTEQDLCGEDGGKVIDVCDLGNLRFVPNENYYGSASFQYRLQDDGGIEHGGNDTSQEKTFQIKIRSVNDDPNLALPDYTSCKTPEPLGCSSRINSEADGSQENPRIAALADGGYVVVWTTKIGDDFDIYARRYNAEGEAFGDEFQVNVDSVGNQSEPTVVAKADGGFTIIWRHQVGSDADIHSRSYDTDGCALSDGETLNVHTGDRQFDPAVGATADGLVVVWTSNGQDGNGRGVFARVLVDGVYTDEFQVNTTTNFHQDQPAVTVLQDGSFVITWTGQDADSQDVFSRHYSYVDDVLVPGQEVLVNTLPAGEDGHEPDNQYQSAVTALSDGGYVIVWTSGIEDDTDIFAQRYDAEGNAVGHRILVNDGQTDDEQRDPAVVALPTGGFMVTWTSWGNADSSLDVYAQRFGTDGYPLGERVLVNSKETDFQQTTPAISVLKDGTVLVAWQSNHESGGDNYEIHAQRFEIMKPYFIEGSSPVLIAPTAKLSDVELDKLNEGAGDWTGATLVVQRDGADQQSGSGFWNWFFQPKSPDHFTFQSGNGYEVMENGLLLKDGELLGRFTQNNGKLTIEFGTYGNINVDAYEQATPTTADVNHVLQSIGYWNSSDDPGESVTLKYRVEDGNASHKGEQGKGGEGEDCGTVTVKLVNVNDAPEARNNITLLQEDHAHDFDINDFRFKDVEGDNLQTVIITGLPDSDKGTLEYYNGCEWIALTGEDLIGGEDEEEGFRIEACNLENLRFVPNENFYGQVTFQYKLQDDGGTERGGQDTSDVATFRINVLSINDNPELDLDLVGYTYVVTTLDDTICDDGKLSLREALEIAKDGESITFAKNLFEDGGEIVLSGTPLKIESNVYINGKASGDSDKRITLKTDGSYTAIDVTACVTEGERVILSGLSIAGGDCVNDVTGQTGAFAAIVNAGTLILNDIEVSGYLQKSEDDCNPDVASVLWNQEGATLKANDLHLHDNSAEGYGGDDVEDAGSAYLIYNQGTMHIVNSTIEDNAVRGGNADEYCGTGGDAYIVYNDDGAYLAVNNNVDIDDCQLTAGTGSIESSGEAANYYLDPECGGVPPYSSFSYTAPHLGLSFTENGEAIRLLPHALLSDPELDARNGGDGDWSGASVTIGPKGEDGHQGGSWWWGWFGWPNHGSDHGEGDPSNELGLDTGYGLSFDQDTGKILKDVEVGDPVAIGSWSVNDQGALVISFQKSPGAGGVIPTTEDVNNVLRLVTYKSTSENPEESVTLGITVKDGNGFLIGTQGLGGEGKGTAEITVILNSVNDAPTFDHDANPLVPKTLEEDQTYVFCVNDFKFADVEENGLGGVVIWTLPTNGKLLIDGRIVTETQLECGGLFVSAEDIACGRFVYQPGENSVGVASFTYKLRDDGGTDHGGEDTTEHTATFTFNVDSINDAPELALSATARYTYVVTTLDDVVNGEDGKLSLREALELACDGDSITFSLDELDCGDGEIVLSSTLNISKQVYINGAIDGGHITLVRGDCMDGPIVAVDCDVGSDAGGAVLQGLVLDGDCVETTSPALTNEGRLTLHDVTIRGNKTETDCEDAVSALYNGPGGVLVATDLTVEDNTATATGDGDNAYAILNDGKLTVDGLSVTDNTQTGGDSQNGEGGDAYALWNNGTYYQGSADFDCNDSTAGTSSAEPCGCEGGPGDGSEGDFGGCDPAATGFTLNFVPPPLTGQGPHVLITEYTAGIVLAPQAVVSDVELDALRGKEGNWDTARIEVMRAGGANPDDVFGFQSEGPLPFVWDGETGNIFKNGEKIATVTNANGALSIHFDGHGDNYPTTEDVTYILRGITYTNSNEHGHSTATIQFTVKDGNLPYDGPQGEGTQGSPGDGTVIGTVQIVVAAPGAPTSLVLDSDSGCDDGITSSLVFTVGLPEGKVAAGNVVRLYKAGETEPFFTSEPLLPGDIACGEVTVSVSGINDFDFSAVTARLAVHAGSPSTDESVNSPLLFVTYDTTEPEQPTLDELGGWALSAEDAESFVVSGTAEAFSRIVVTVTPQVEAPVGTYTTNADANGRFSVQVSAEGASEVEVKAYDRAGNDSLAAVGSLSITPAESEDIVDADPTTAEGYTDEGNSVVNFSLAGLTGNGGIEWFISASSAFATVMLGGYSDDYTITLVDGQERADLEISAPVPVSSDLPLYQIKYWPEDFGTPTELYVQVNAVQFDEGGLIRLTAHGIVGASDACDELVIHGGAGNDRIVGGDGDDALFGHDGNNILIGGTGNDILVSYSAGSSGDVLIGGDGHDLLIAMGDASTAGSPINMYGGCGEDIFAIAPLTDDQAKLAGDLNSAGFNRDITIHDFVIGEDRIDLSMLRVEKGEGQYCELTEADLNLAGLITQLTTDASEEGGTAAGTMTIDLSQFVGADGSEISGTLTVSLAGGSAALTEQSFILTEACSVLDDFIADGFLFDALLIPQDPV